MSVSIQSHVAGNVAVVRLCGHFSALDSTILRDVVRGLIEKGIRQIVFNLAELTYIDSFGLGQLVAAYTTVRSERGNVKLVKPNEWVRELLRITKLDTVFEILSNEPSAIQTPAAAGMSRAA
jgi:anti-sigma B factor antagonist